MIFLATAIGANVCMTFLMKYSETHHGNRYALNIWNYLTGTIVSFFLLKDKSRLIVNDGGVTFLLSVVNGILFVAAMVMIQQSIRKNGAPLTTTFNRLGILIPTVLSAILFAEIPGGVQILGLLLCVFAIIYMNTGKKEERPAFATGLLLIFVLGGMVDFLSKIYSRYFEKENQTYFVLYTFLAACIISTVMFFRQKRKMKLQDVLIGIGVGIPNQLTTLLILWASMKLPAYIVYPTYSAGLILLVNVINFIVFREKLSRRQYMATGLIGAGLICINIFG